MGAGTDHLLTAAQVRQVVAQVERSASREACWSCECLQGFITQLEQNATEEGRQVLEVYRVRPEHLHGCLGCESCPPADLFAVHLKSR
jgi:hypothetical protein